MSIIAVMLNGLLAVLCVAGLLEGKPFRRGSILNSKEINDMEEERYPFIISHKRNLRFPSLNTNI